jgi:hypothetical protein
MNESTNLHRITLAANSVDAKPVHIDVAEDRVLAYTEALHMLDARRQAEGTTPLVIASVVPL